MDSAVTGGEGGADGVGASAAGSDADGLLELRLEGSRIRDIPSLYAELDRVLMVGVDWRLGASLDALDDLLHGGFGTLHGHDRARILWADHRVAREALGVAATREQLLGKLARPDVYNAETARLRLAALEAGVGPTYFETVLEVFADHPRIELVLA